MRYTSAPMASQPIAVPSGRPNFHQEHHHNNPNSEQSKFQHQTSSGYDSTNSKTSSSSSGGGGAGSFTASNIPTSASGRPNFHPQQQYQQQYDLSSFEHEHSMNDSDPMKREIGGILEGVMSLPSHTRDTSHFHPPLHHNHQPLNDPRFSIDEDETNDDAASTASEIHYPGSLDERKMNQIYQNMNRSYKLTNPDSSIYNSSFEETNSYLNEQTNNSFSSSSSSSRARCMPFLEKTYKMIETCPDRLASWNQAGDSFIVYKPKEFAETIIPLYFKHRNFSSFVRQLNFYGFRKTKASYLHHQRQQRKLSHSGNNSVKTPTSTDSSSLSDSSSEVGNSNSLKDHWEFRHDRFIRGRPELLKTIRRRKSSLTMDTNSQYSVSPYDNSGRFGGGSYHEPSSAKLISDLKKEVELLRRELGESQKNMRHMLSVINHKGLFMKQSGEMAAKVFKEATDFAYSPNVGISGPPASNSTSHNKFPPKSPTFHDTIKDLCDDNMKTNGNEMDFLSSEVDQVLNHNYENLKLSEDSPSSPFDPIIFNSTSNNNLGRHDIDPTPFPPRHSKPSRSNNCSTSQNRFGTNHDMNIDSGLMSWI